MRIHTVVVNVEVQVRFTDDNATNEQIVSAALAASSHNQCNPNRSSVLSLGAFGDVEVVDQKISYIQRGKR